MINTYSRILEELNIQTLLFPELNNELVYNWQKQNTEFHPYQHKTGRVHAVVFHLRIIDGKICIEWDGMERGITGELLELGVEKDDIILGFIRPEYRQFTDFSVA